MLDELNLDALADQMQTHGQLHHMDVRRLIAELRASRKVVEAAKRLTDGWVMYETLVDFGDPQAVALRDALSTVNVRNEEK